MYQIIKQFLKTKISAKSPETIIYIHNHKTPIKYIMSGCVAVFSQLVVLYVLTDIFGLWYVASSAIAFIVSFFTSFVLQKFWTFRDPSIERMSKQFAIYIILGVSNFLLNPSLLFVLVEYLGVWYMLGQAIVGLVLAIGNYIVNKFITFKKSDLDDLQKEASL